MYPFNTKEEFEQKRNAIKPIDIRLKTVLINAKVNPKLKSSSFPEIPSCIITKPKVNLTIEKIKKYERNSDTYKSHLFKIKEPYKDYFKVYTDGFKYDTRCSVISYLHRSRIRLPDDFLSGS